MNLDPSIDANSYLLLEKYGWRTCGDDHYDHPDYPMQQFHINDAIKLCREMCRKDLQRA